MQTTTHTHIRIVELDGTAYHTIYDGTVAEFRSGGPVAPTMERLIEDALATGEARGVVRDLDGDVTVRVMAY